MFSGALGELVRRRGEKYYPLLTSRNMRAFAKLAVLLDFHCGICNSTKNISM